MDLPDSQTARGSKGDSRSKPSLRNSNCSTAKGDDPLDPKIAGRQAYLEISEEQLYKNYMKLFQDIIRYNPDLRPEDFAEAPSIGSKDSEQLRLERDFHNRWIALCKAREEMEKLRQELSHLSSDPGEKIFDSEAPLVIADALIKEHFLFEESENSPILLRLYFGNGMV